MTPRSDRGWRYPVAVGVGLAVGHVVAVYNGMPVAWEFAVRPVIVAIVVGAVIGIVARTLVRRESVAALATLAAIAAVLGAIELAVVVAIALTAWVVWRASKWREEAPSLVAVGAAAAWLSVAFAVTGLLVTFITGAVTVGELVPRWGAAAAGADRPTIYLVLLDGYPRGDVLREHFRFDNSAFLDALEDRGFDVYADAESNYSETSMTLASMLSAAPLEDLLPDGIEDASLDQQYRALRRAMAAGESLDALRAAGYRILTTVPTAESTALAGAERLGPQGRIGEFEIALLTETVYGRLILGLVPDLILQDHVDRIRSDLRAMADAPRTDAVVFGHVLAPHAPWIFDDELNVRPMPECFPEACPFFGPWTAASHDELLATAYVPHVQGTNRLVLDAVDRLPDDSIVVLFSDHGSRSERARDHFLTFLAARTPGHPELFGDEPTPTVWFPRLLNAYAGLDLDERRVGHWAARGFALTDGLVERNPADGSELSPTGP